MLIKAAGTKLVGKEYKRILVDSTVEVTHFFKVKCSIHDILTERIWERRRCFMCGGKFKDGDAPMAAITERGTNKIICEGCYPKIKGEVK